MHSSLAVTTRAAAGVGGRKIMDAKEVQRNSGAREGVKRDSRFHREGRERALAG